MDSLGTFSHDTHADMFAGKRVQMGGVKAYTVVTDDQREVLTVINADGNVMGERVFADVGQALLKDEDNLQLFVVV